MEGTFEKHCCFSSWYPNFEEDSVEATILELPEKILKYIDDDLFLLPVEATKRRSGTLEWSDGSFTEIDNSDEAELPTFPEFSRRIQSIIKDYGAIFIKTNWSSPLDVLWMTPTKTLKCTSLDEVYLLLKSSNRISTDLSAVEGFNNNGLEVNPCLVAKKWIDVRDGAISAYEYRCFVVNKTLIGICQRDVSHYYEQIETEKYSIQNDIKKFFDERVKDRFPMDNYTMDVIRYKKNKVKILDFGLLNETATEETLFTYEELLNNSIVPPEFRFIATERGIQPKKHFYCAPEEVLGFLQHCHESMSDDDI